MNFNWKKIVQNKYVMASILFLVWVTFINDIDLIFIMKSRGELSEMKEQLEYYENQNATTSESLSEITSDKNTLERFAREQYFMKKSNEDIFVIRENLEAQP
ncbi:MAG: FtsB family cell division protein [Flavobacteriales bacterium]